MWLKKKKSSSSIYADQTARFIAGGIVSLQTRLTRVFQRWESKASLRQKKSALIIFCMLAGAYCFYLLGDALLRKPTIIDYQPLIPAKDELMIHPGPLPPAPGTLTHTVSIRHRPVIPRASLQP